jgi:hypothetical protein
LSLSPMVKMWRGMMSPLLLTMASTSTEHHICSCPTFLWELASSARLPVAKLAS